MLYFCYFRSQVEIEIKKRMKAEAAQDHMVRIQMLKNKTKKVESPAPILNITVCQTTNVSPELVCILRMTIQGDRTGQLPK